MKKLLILSFALALMLLPTKVNAATWSTNGNKMYYNNGNIGIGTSDPWDPLQIANKSVGNYDTNWGKMLIGDDGGSHWFGSWVYKNGSTITSASSNMVSNGYLDTYKGWEKRNSALETWTLGNYVTDNSTGYFQIAYSAPQGAVKPISNWKAVLKINSSGTVYVNKLVVKDATSGWADYVFEDSYNLPLLSEVEEYIQVNKHLKGVPTASEIKDKGISVDDMLVIHMEKIEELTLYTIQQDKQIKDLEKQNSDLNGRLERLEKLIFK